MTTHTQVSTHRATAVDVRHCRSLDPDSTHTWLEITVTTADRDRLTFVIHPDDETNVTATTLLRGLWASATAAEDHLMGQEISPRHDHDAIGVTAAHRFDQDRSE